MNTIVSLLVQFWITHRRSFSQTVSYLRESVSWDLSCLWTVWIDTTKERHKKKSRRLIKSGELADFISPFSDAIGANIYNDSSYFSIGVPIVILHTCGEISPKLVDEYKYESQLSLWAITVAYSTTDVRLRSDGATIALWSRGKCLVWDIKISCTVAASYLENSATIYNSTSSNR